MANLILDTDKFVQYKYKVTEFFIIINGKSEAFPIERISDIRITNDFEKMLYPMFKISMVMEASRYYNIIKNKNNVKFKIRLQSFYTIDNEPDNKSMLIDVINDTFVFYTNENNDDYEKNLKKESQSENDKDIDVLHQTTNNIEFYLFKEQINGLKSSFNTVLQGSDLSTAVTYLLGKAKVKNVLMSPIENSKSYTLLIPPTPIDKTIIHLSNQFGFHKKGTMVYFGLLHNYILNCKPGCTAWGKNEYQETNILILDKTDHHSNIASMIIRKGEKKYYANVLSDGVDIKSNAGSTNIISGTENKVIDARTGSISGNSSGNDIQNKNPNYVYSTSGNSFSGESISSIYNSNLVVITMAMENIPLEAFTPNKKFNIIFEETKLNSMYKGSYRLANSVFTLSNLNADGTVMAVFTFKKIA